MTQQTLENLLNNLVYFNEKYSVSYVGMAKCIEATPYFMSKVAKGKSTITHPQGFVLFLHVAASVYKKAGDAGVSDFISKVAPDYTQSELSTEVLFDYKLLTKDVLNIAFE